MPASRARKLSQLMSEGGSLDTQIDSSGTSGEIGAAGVIVYDTVNDLPTTGLTAGDEAFVSGSNRLYISNGTGWYSVALVNTNPAITSVEDPSSNTTPFTLATDGSALVITITAEDPEDIPLIYSYAVTTGSLTNGGGTTATVVQGTGANTNQFTITPTTTEAYAGTFELTFTTSDGINQASSVNSFTLQFMDLVSGASFNLSTGGYYDTAEKVEGTHSLYLNGNGHVQRYIVSPSTPYVYDDYTISMWFQKYNTNTLYLFNVNDKLDPGNSFGSACTIITSTNNILHVVDRYNGSSYAQNPSINTNMVNSTVYTGGGNNEAWYHYVVSYSVSSNVIGQWITSQGGTFGDILNRTGSPNRQGIGLKTNLWYLHGSAGNASDNGRANYDAIHILNTAADVTVAENLYNGNAPASTKYRFLFNGNGDNA